MGQGEGSVGGRALPRWLQVSEGLIREIGAGRLPCGARLPPEREMAAGLGVAIGTLRKALADLAGKGLLDRRQGSGNYVRRRAGVESVYAMFRLERVTGGGLPTAELIDLRRLAKPEGAPAFGASAEAHRIRRLRRLDGAAVALEEVWLDAGLGPSLRPEDLSESLYLSWRRVLGVEIAEVEDRVGVAPAPPWTCGAFRPPAGALVGHVERLGRLPDGAAAEYSRTWFDPDRARYVSRVGGGTR